MWTDLTDRDIRDALSDREVESYARAASGPDWDPEAAARICAKTASLVRGYIATAPKRPALGPGRTLPEALIGPAADYAAVTLLRRIPKEIRKERLDARAEAIEIFKAVAKGEVEVEPYSAAAPAAASPRRVSALAAPRSRVRASAAQLEGTP